MNKIIIALTILLVAGCASTKKKDNHYDGERAYGRIGIYNDSEYVVYLSDSGYVEYEAWLMLNDKEDSVHMSWMRGFHTKDGRAFGTLHTAFFEPYDKKYKKELRFRPEDSENEEMIKRVWFIDSAKLFPPGKQHEIRMGLYACLSYPPGEPDHSIPYINKKNHVDYALIWDNKRVVTEDYNIDLTDWTWAACKCYSPFYKIWQRGDSMVTYQRWIEDDKRWHERVSIHIGPVDGGVGKGYGMKSMAVSIKQDDIRTQ
jgi:hypothetical protein